MTCLQQKEKQSLKKKQENNFHGRHRREKRGQLTTLVRRSAVPSETLTSCYTASVPAHQIDFENNSYPINNGFENFFRKIKSPNM